jgi:hypothetical protein
MVASKLIDHGIPAPADEARTAAICVDAAGRSRLVIAARGFVVIADPATGASVQRFFPDGYVEYPFGSLAARDGRFYTGAGRLFMALDPFTGEWLHASNPVPGDSITAFSLAEGPDGAIWGATYPHCHLFRYDPATGGVADYGAMDETQEYPFHLAVDRLGWVYLGIGTERRNLVAFRPATGERRSLVPPEARTRGTGYVHPGVDGEVYGHYEQGWYRFSEGTGTPLGELDVVASQYAGKGFERVHRSVESGMELVSHSLPEHEVVLRVRESGLTRRITLAYESAGAALAPMTVGPDGNLWGTSMHPLQLYTYRAQEGRIVNFGGQAVERGGGGNICAWAARGRTLVGAAYAGGFLHVLDPDRPITPGGGTEPNPRLVNAHEEIHRPRCALAHPDGQHVVWGGFAGYGAVGGALGIYNVKTGEDRLLPNAGLVPDQSTLCLGALAGGDLIGGTSILAPGGAQPRAPEAVLYRLCWETGQVLWQCAPVPGAREIALLQVDDHQRVHALTGDSLYFVFDPERREMIHRHDLSQYGEVVRDGLRFGPGGQLYGLLRRAIVRIDPENFAVTPLLTEPPMPITAGMGMLGGRLYFGSGSHLISYPIEEGRP